MIHMIVSILAFFLVLSILVLIHEAGHFFTAKKFGIKVEEFGFGFPPKLFGKKYGETEYTINALPIGGFVKLYGEDEAGAGRVDLSGKKHEVKGDIKRAFYARPAWQRFLVVVAGVVMNFLLAVVILTYLYAVPGVPTPGETVIVTNIMKGSPAEKAHVQVGDIISGVDQLPVHSTSELVSYVKAHAGRSVTLHVTTPNGQKSDISVTPRSVTPKNQGALGVEIAVKLVMKRYPWYQAPFVGVKETLIQSWQILAGIGQVIAQVVTTGSVPAGVAGPVGLARITGDVVRSGFDATLALLAALSLNLAILNILPIPALDGGRFFFILIEMITRKKVNQKFETYAHTIGMALLLGLIILITIHDVLGIIHNTPVLP